MSFSKPLLTAGHQMNWSNGSIAFTVAQRSVSHFEFLSLRSKLIEHLATLRINALIEAQYILEADTPITRRLQNGTVGHACG